MRKVSPSIPLAEHRSPPVSRLRRSNGRPRTWIRIPIDFAVTR